MRHNKKFNHLSRKSAHRQAMLANMTISLIIHKRIYTTLAKAKALRIYAEPIINRAKKADFNSMRIVFRDLQNKEAVKELFQVVGPKIMDRPGGFTRIIKTGTRLGDAAKTCFIELVDFNETMLAAKAEAPKKASTRRSRRSGKKAEAAPAAEAPVAEQPAEAPAAE